MRPLSPGEARELIDRGTRLDCAAEPKQPRPVQARAVRPTVYAPGRMNKTEARYASYLSLLQAQGLVLDWSFESIKLRLGPDWKTSYTPDFLVITQDGSLELHEVKGASKGKGNIKGAHWRDGARDKIKIAARLFPFRFIAVWPRVRKAGGGWHREVFPPEKELHE